MPDQEIVVALKTWADAEVIKKDDLDKEENE